MAVTGKIFGSSQRIFCEPFPGYDALENRFQSVLKDYSPLEDSIPWPKKEDIALIEAATELSYRANNDMYYIYWHNISKEKIQYLGRSFAICFNRFNALRTYFTKIFREDIIRAFQKWMVTHPRGTIEEFLQEPIRNPLCLQERISRIKLMRRIIRIRNS